MRRFFDFPADGGNTANLRRLVPSEGRGEWDPELFLRMETFVFLEVPGPGAMARFLERHADHESGDAEVFLSDALGPSTLRALTGAAEIIEPWLGVLEGAFGPGVRVFQIGDRNWSSVIVSDGRLVVNDTGSVDAERRWWERLLGLPRPASSLTTALARHGIPMRRLEAPRTIVDLATVDQLDQRRLLVETVPVRYRIPIARTPKVQ